MTASLLAPYVGLLAFIYVGLTINVTRMRRSVGVGIGDGDNLELRRAIRAHANFAEYTPFAVVLFWLLAEVNINSTLISELMGFFIVARLMHIYSVLRAEPTWGSYRFRTYSMVLTVTIISLSAVLLFAYQIGVLLRSH